MDLTLPKEVRGRSGLQNLMAPMFLWLEKARAAATTVLHSALAGLQLGLLQLGLLQLGLSLLLEKHPPSFLRIALQSVRRVICYVAILCPLPSPLVTPHFGREGQDPPSPTLAACKTASTAVRMLCPQSLPPPPPVNTRELTGCPTEMNLCFPREIIPSTG